MEHKRVWTPVVDNKLTCIAFSQHAQEFRRQYTYTSLLHPREHLLWRFSHVAQIFEWAGADTISFSTGNRADTIRGRILFDMRVLFEEIRYMQTDSSRLCLGDTARTLCAGQVLLSLLPW